MKEELTLKSVSLKFTKFTSTFHNMDANGGFFIRGNNSSKRAVSSKYVTIVQVAIHAIEPFEG